MRIEKIEIKNFKRLVEIQFYLKGINYIIGGNNSGKSSLLQAIHMSITAGQTSAELGQQLLSGQSLKYCPTGNFQSLANTSYENRSDGARASVEFFGANSDNIPSSYKIRLYKARNYNNIGVERTGIYAGFGQVLLDSKTLFSIYIPGLAGIPPVEDMYNYAYVLRKAAGGEANLVLRNIIRLIHLRGNMDELKSILEPVIGQCEIIVRFDEEKDLYVDVDIKLENETRSIPLDLIGTGILQIIQIMSYVVLFRSKLLLIDEPDSHIHASRQIQLAKAFQVIADKFGCQIILSTHSRHLVSSALADDQVIWMRNGAIECTDRPDLAKLLMDLGALDQMDQNAAEIIICTEDKGKRQLSLSAQAIAGVEKVIVLSYNGTSSAASAALIAELNDLLPNKARVIVHRDRDFLTSEEVEKWSREFKSRGIEVFCPRLCDIESYVCLPQHVASVYEMDASQAKHDISQIIKEHMNQIRAKFKDKRREAIKRYHSDGGGPKTDELWPPGSEPNEDQIYGKQLEGWINERFKDKPGGRRNLQNFPSQGLIKELKEFLGVDKT